MDGSNEVANCLRVRSDQPRQKGGFLGEAGQAIVVAQKHIHRATVLGLEFRGGVVVAERHSRRLGKVPPLHLAELQVWSQSGSNLNVRHFQINLLPIRD